MTLKPFFSKTGATVALVWRRPWINKILTGEAGLAKFTLEKVMTGSGHWPGASDRHEHLQQAKQGYDDDYLDGRHD